MLVGVGGATSTVKRHTTFLLRFQNPGAVGECEGEPEVPPAETQRAPIFRTSTSTQSTTTGDEEMWEVEAKGMGILRSVFE